MGENDTDFAKILKDQEQRKLDWLGKPENEEYRKYLYALENHDAVQCDLTAFFDSDNDFKCMYFEKFLQIFPDSEQMDWMLRHQALMSVADYARMEGSLALYAGDKKSMWRERVFQRNNETVYPHLFALLDKIDTGIAGKDALKAIRKDFIKSCEEHKQYPWRYYAAKYRGLQHGELLKVYKTEDTKYKYQAVNKQDWRDNSYNWNPFLIRIKKDSDYQGRFNLDNYNSYLELKGLPCRVWCEENSYHINPVKTKEPEFILPIPQEDSIDTVDRIDWFLKFYDELYRLGKSKDIIGLNELSTKYGIKPKEDGTVFSDLFIKKEEKDS